MSLDLRSLAELWESFKRSYLVLDDRTPEEIDAARKIFYAGAAAGFGKMVLVGDHEGPFTDEEVAALDAFENEVTSFALTLLAPPAKSERH